MKTIASLLVLTISLLSINCNNHSAEVTAFTNEKSEVVAQMCQTVNDNPTDAGIEKARAIFDARKADLKSRWDAIIKLNLGLREMKPILDGDVSDGKIWDGVREKNGAKMLPVKDKFYSLENDFNDFFKH